MKTYLTLCSLLAIVLLIHAPARSSETENSFELEIERGPGRKNEKFFVESSNRFDTNWKGFELEANYSRETETEKNKFQSLEKLKTAVREVNSRDEATAQSLLSSLETINRKIGEIKRLSKPINIEKLEDLTEVIVEEYEEKIIEPLEDGVRKRYIARVLNIAERTEKIIDYLEYTMMKTRLYGRKELKPKIGGLLRETLLTAIHGEKEKYLKFISKLFSIVEQNRKTKIKEESATRILDKLDYLMEKEGGEKTYKEVGATIRKTIGEGEIELELNNLSIATPHPSGEEQEYSLSAEMTKKIKTGEVELSYTEDYRNYFHGLSEDKDRRSRKIKFQAEEELGGIGLRGNLDWKHQFYPNEIGNALIPDRADIKKDKIKKLKDSIEKMAIPPEATEELVLMLKEAIKAIDGERYEKAVDELEDCLDEAGDYKWEGKISPGQKEKIENKVRSILPRKSRVTKTWKVAFSCPVRNDNQKASIRKKVKRYPAHRDLNRAKTTRKVELKRSLSNYSFEASWKKVNKFYWRAKYKNRVTTEGELGFAQSKNNFRWEWTFSAGRKNYPRQRERLEKSRENELVCKWKTDPSRIKASLEQGLVRFPFDDGKKNEKEIEGGIELKNYSEYGKFGIELKLSREEENYAQKSENKDEEEKNFYLGLHWQRETDRWSAELGVNWERHLHPFEREENEEQKNLFLSSTIYL